MNSGSRVIVKRATPKGHTETTFQLNWDEAKRSEDERSCAVAVELRVTSKMHIKAPDTNGQNSRRRGTRLWRHALPKARALV